MGDARGWERVARLRNARVPGHPLWLTGPSHERPRLPGTSDTRLDNISVLDRY
ncbi:hypothetical protein GCM10023238_39710 [Streptomyces heliomycini]